MLIVLATFLAAGCSSVPDHTTKTLEKQIELQQVQHELASEPVRAEKKTAAEYEQQGDMQLSKGDINRAYLSYLKGLQTEPDRVSLLQKQGRLLLTKKKYVQAEPVYAKLMRLAGDDTQTLIGQSMMFFGLGKFDEAEKGFLTVLAKKDNIWQAHAYLGLIHSRKQEFDQAIGRFKTALAYKPRDVNITNNLAVTCYLNGNFAEAASLLENLAATTRDKRVYNNLALAHFQLRHYDKALEYFKKGSQSDAVAYNNMGREYLLARKYEQAIEAFEKAITLNPVFYVAAQENLEYAKSGLSRTITKSY